MCSFKGQLDISIYATGVSPIIVANLRIDLFSSIKYLIENFVLMFCSWIVVLISKLCHHFPTMQ
jgi:hypothetical protein